MCAHVEVVEPPAGSKLSDCVKLMNCEELGIASSGGSVSGARQVEQAIRQATRNIRERMMQENPDPQAASESGLNNYTELQLQAPLQCQTEMGLSSCFKMILIDTPGPNEADISPLLKDKVCNMVFYAAAVVMLPATTYCCGCICLVLNVQMDSPTGPELATCCHCITVLVVGNTTATCLYIQCIHVHCCCRSTS